jgi:hypothetical protein
MGSKVFERNERHAAWELSWGPPGGLLAPPPWPKSHANLEEKQITKKKRTPQQREAFLGPRPAQGAFYVNCCFFIENVSFSLEKCVFGANRGVLAYVLKREWALQRKKCDL